MKILFICGSLEPGKDGIGDYTRKLSAELIKIKHEVKIFALHDRYIAASERVMENQKCDGYNIEALRYSSEIRLNKKISVLKDYINEFNPDWISLQYVPYGFQLKGLPFNLPVILGKACGDRNFHIMFHELWVGISVISPIKHKLIGYFQRWIAKSLIRKSNAKLITTTNFLYKEVLKHAGIQSQILSLFSNIPIKKSIPDFELKLLRELNIEKCDREQWMIAGIFGSLYPEANLASAIEKHYKDAESEHKKLAFISFGRMNERGIKEYERLKNIFSNRMSFLYLGEQSEENVSLLLQLLDYGISCTPTQHLGKSGVYAAMKLHGLRVTLTSYEYLPEYDALMKDYQQVFEDRDAYKWSVEYMASQFIDLLPHKQNKLKLKHD